MKVKCMNKVRDGKGNIVKYQLMDENGNKIEATSKEIKAEIKAGKYEFINLQIDKAGRLVDKATAKDKPAKTKKTTAKTKQATAKTKQATVKTKQEALQEKKNQAKEEVKDYIKLMRKEYTCERGGDEMFIKDFKGEGNIEIIDSSLVSIDRMTPATKNYFGLMIEQIRKKALTDCVEAYRYGYENESFSASFPESVNKFMEASELDSCISEALFYLAKDDSKLALIQCGYDDMSDGFVGEMILTANYDKAKRFMLEKVREESENIEVSPTELMLEGNYVQGDNMIGRVFILKLYAEIQKLNVDHYEDQVRVKACKYTYEYEGKNIADLNIEEQAKVIGRTLRREACGLSYLALKLGVLPQRDDYDTPEEKEIEDKIKAEAKRLAEQIGGMEWIVANMAAKAEMQADLDRANN